MIFHVFGIDGYGSGKLHKLGSILYSEYHQPVQNAGLHTDTINTDNFGIFQETQQSEQSATITISSEQSIWQTQEDVVLHLERFNKYCEQEEYIHAFNTIFDSYDYENCVYNFLSSSGYVYEIVTRFKRLLQSWQPRKSEKLVFEAALTCLGEAYHRLGEHQKAIDKYKDALKIALEIDDPDGVAGSLVNLGFVYHSLEQYEEAMEYSYRGLALARQIGHREFEANALNNLGLAYHSLEQYHLAIDYYHHSLEIKQKLGDRQGEASSLINIGDNYRILGQYQQAREFLQQGIEIAHQSGHRQFEANGWFNLGLFLEELTQKDLAQKLEAIDAYEQARGLFDEMRLDACVEDCKDAIRHLREDLDGGEG